MGAHTVRIANGCKRFGTTRQVLTDIDLVIDDGDFLAVLGRSGSGTSTLLRVIAGRELLTSGDVEWSGGRALSRPQTGVVFQQALLMPWLTVAENVAFAGRFAAHRTFFEPSYAAELMTRFDLAHVADRYPDQLSGGQAQRVAIIRAVATRPRLLLLDEPFSALDPATRSDLREWLAELAEELDVTVVLVTHDIEDAVALADRIVLLGEDGQIRGEWQPEIGSGRSGADGDALRHEILRHYRLGD